LAGIQRWAGSRASTKEPRRVALEVALAFA
jgi:hypothetical protein